jgi:hypothetical protein
MNHAPLPREELEALREHGDLFEPLEEVAQHRRKDGALVLLQDGTAGVVISELTGGFLAVQLVKDGDCCRSVAIGDIITVAVAGDGRTFTRV